MRATKDFAAAVGIGVAYALAEGLCACLFLSPVIGFGLLLGWVAS